ncbi:MAG TPA: nucleoid occlusion factor SlmA [Burkholderiaceae bacterium]|jgi:TetR/AcrR family transcriptional regulator|nr:nucleoid occlusion factor SlmA [Burkholderiaceae bacterium]
MEIPTQTTDSAESGRTRRKPGTRRLQILQTLASMLEDPRGEKVTTAALAARLDVSEAALYRHFASKAQMFEGLIEFIETTIFGLINDISTKEQSGLRQARRIVQMLLEFAQTNRGLTRVLIGDALVNENDRLQDRMNQLLERIEASLRQSLRVAVSQGELPADLDTGARAALAVAYVLGRWHRFAKGGFRKQPTEGLEVQLTTMVGPAA